MFKLCYKTLLAGFLAALLPLGSAQALEKPVLIAEQGSFFAGGNVKQEAGNFDFQAPANSQGQTIHGDHAYVFYQKPVKAHKYPLVFLHGAGQSAKTWESTPDGRDGFQNIFLSHGYSTYLVDQPRRGRAGNSTIDGKVPALALDQLWFSNFRFGNWPNFFPGVKVPKDKDSLEQFFRQITPNTAAFDEQIISDAMAAVFAKVGKGVLITHSQGGGPGWWTAIKSKNVKAVVAFEPGSGFVFPNGEVPPALETSSPFGVLKGVPIALSDFEKLTRIPIIIYYGDYIPLERTEEWNKDNWRVRLIMAREWTDTINRHGGNAIVVHLPEIGLKGNTHFLFADLNNKQIADHMEQWLKDNRLN